MNKIAEILTQVQEESNENIILCLEELIDESKFTYYDLSEKQDKSEYFMSGGQNLDIKKGTEFNVIFNIEKPHEYVSSPTRLSKIKLRKNLDLEILPEGYAGLILIDFLEEKPDIIEILDRERGIYKALYLTSQSVMDRILELL